MPAALVVGQSGGVTPVINASLAGVIGAAQAAPQVGAIYGMRHGVRGLLEENLLRLDGAEESFLARLAATPGAWLGSCRHAPDEAEIEQLVARLRALDARYFVYAGGNDSADTSARLDAHARRAGWELQVVNVPKTIDNDLPDMDHTPGYPTAAAFVALSTRLLLLDTASMCREEPVRVIEVKGRHSGWLAAAAAAFAPCGPGEALHVYLPEQPLSAARALADVDGSLSRHGHAVLVVSEHAVDEAGNDVGAREPRYRDAFGHGDSTGPGAWLQGLVESELKRRCRLEVLGALQKVALLPELTLDREEALQAGRHAVAAAVAGESGRCVTIGRAGEGPYTATFGLTELSRVARMERLMPEPFMGESGPTDAFRAWVAPLIDGIRPQVERLVDSPAV